MVLRRSNIGLGTGPARHPSLFTQTGTLCPNSGSQSLVSSNLSLLRKEKEHDRDAEGTGSVSPIRLADPGAAVNQFENRADAGRRLGEALHSLRGSDSVVLGLPRGGVPVAAEVAEALDLPLDVLIVRKLGLPDHPEVAMGAIGEGGIRVLDPEIIALGRVSQAQVDAVEADEVRTLQSRVTRFRRGRDPIDLAGRTALIVDDGIATGATARAACLIARQLGASHTIVAAPVGSREAVQALDVADEVVCLLLPQQFYAVGAHYRDFTATTEDEVEQLLNRASERIKHAHTQRSGRP